MKKLYLILFLFAAIKCDAQTYLPSSCTGLQLLSQTYKKDIANLAVSRIYELQNADTASIEIPQTYIDTITRGLYAIFNLDTAIQADSVFRAYCIHNYDLSIADLEVYADPAESWTANWLNNHITTGYTALDSFLSIYHYQLVSSFQVSGTIVAYLHTDDLINTKAIANILPNYHGIAQAKNKPTIGSGSRILFTKDNIYHYNFYLAWGDCPSGCTSYKVWQYAVDDNCAVAFIGTAEDVHDPRPTPPNCNVFPVSVKNAVNNIESNNIYPNPTSGFIYTSAVNDLHYTLFDMYGKITRTGILSKTLPVDVNILPAGIYILRTADELGAQSMQKIIKQ